MKLRNVIFPLSEDAANADTGPDAAPAPGGLWDIDLVDGVIRSIAPAGEARADEEQTTGQADGPDDNIASRLLLPPLCHPHIHLDKAYLLTGHEGAGSRCPCGGPGSGGSGGSSGSSGSGGSSGGDGADRDRPSSYADLLPRTGAFAEALHSTAAAKARFTPADLRRRGAQLLATSYRQGVTAARVFVEVDAGGGGAPPQDGPAPPALHPSLAVALELRAAFRGRVAVQVCAFAQEVLFTGAAGTANRQAIEAALAHPAAAAAVAVLGTAPYVEATHALALQNLDWAVATARAHDLHLDVHLDYNLDPVAEEGGQQQQQQPLLYALLDALERHDWPREGGSGRPCRTVVVGHATRLTRLSSAALHRLAARIRKQRLPVHFVGLPTSDLYMMGKKGDGDDHGHDHDHDHDHDEPLFRPRGTLPVPLLVRRFGLRACLGVNNVGNAFTPHGTGDPLQLACWGVGLYHAGTVRDAQILYGSVSWAARAAIGVGEDTDDNNDSASASTASPPRWLVDPTARRASARIGPLLLVANEREIRLPPPRPATENTSEAEKALSLDHVPARGRFSVRDVVWDPPEMALRRIV